MNYGYSDYPIDSMISSGVNSTVSAGMGVIIWTIIAAIVAIVGGILIYFLLLKPNKKTDNKFLKWIIDFLNFKNILLETIIKITYAISAIFITLVSFNFIGTSFVAFLLCLILGNLILRVVYESCVMILMIWRNTNDINSKIKK